MYSIKAVNLVIFYSLCLTYFTDACALARYKAKPLDQLIHNVQSGEVGFEYKIFTKRDCKKYLGRRRIISKGYTPVQMSIVNNTDRQLQFSLNDLSLSTVSYDEVAHRVHFSSVGRIFAWIVPWALIVIPLCVFELFLSTAAVVSGNGGTDWKLITFGFALPALTIATLPTIAAAEGVQVSRAQQHLVADYKHKSLQDCVVAPSATINGVVFVKTRELQSHFSLTFSDALNNKDYKLSTDKRSIAVNSSSTSYSVLVPDFTAWKL